MAVDSPPAPTYRVAEVGDIEQLAANIKDGFLECRDFGHVWKTAEIVREKGHYNRWLFCSRCKTNRRQTLSLDGEILGSYYEYMEGYQFKGIGRMMADGRMALRREAIERAASKGKVREGVSDDESQVVTPRKRA